MSEAKKVLEWLLDCAKYFENRDTGGEDAMHWANVYNAENARAIAAAWTADRDRAEKAEARVKVLEAAIEPFAGEADRIEHGFTYDLPDNYISPYSLQLGHFRAARAAKEQS